jgi:ABC-type nickel/cobalt efflux system permease component RcnA
MANKPLLMPLFLAGWLMVGLLWAPTPGLAHPLGNFSISHYTGIRVERDVIELHYVLDMAEIPTFQVIQETGIVPEVGHASVSGYLTRQTEVLLEGLRLEVNGQRLPLEGVSSEVLFPPGAGGLPTLKLGLQYRARLATAAADTLHHLHFQDNNFPGRAGWQEIIAVAGPGITLVRSSVPETDRSRALTDYPTDMLNSPPQMRQAQVVFRPASPPQVVAAVEAPAPPRTAPPPLTTNRQTTPRNAFTELMTTPQLSLGIVCLALAVATGLGAFHALEPGHGKTVVAAYLVGTRGTARDALYLGLIVTATHTAGVYLLGAVTLYASHYVVPERLYPWMGVVSGLIIAVLGGYLFLRRYAGETHTHSHVHTPMQAYPHGHTHAHTHGHPHVHYDTSHHELAHHHSHTHAVSLEHHHEQGQSVSFRQLLALGVTGGIIPCPAALVVLLSAFALHRVGFGLLLIVAFSIGLAAVLIAVGLVMVYAQNLLSHWQGEGQLVRRWLPMTSAVTITAFGLAIAVQALMAAGILQIRL